MCGIAGIVCRDPSAQVDAAVLERMCDVIVHRGPDERGIRVLGNAGLGMQRLSIIDLAGGSQPIHNEDKTLWVVFNGEIYNFPALRAELESQGHEFYTRADTETVIHAYESFGDNCVTHLNGMFAFALWDSAQQRLLMARDRMGKKPLYYTYDDERLVFGSELKVLLQHGGFQRRISLEAFSHYLTLQYIPSPLTIFEGVYKLPPAYLLVWQDGNISTQCYWDLHYEPKRLLSEREWIALVREELTEAVRRRLISEVPLGAFLSGGVDSSIIVALMAQLMNEPVKTFSIGFKEQRFSELDFARTVAARHHTQHHEFIVEFDALPETLPRLVWHLDEPMADSSALAVWYLACMTRQYVTVALNGDGGDETFAGYLRYVLDGPLNVYRMLPRLVRMRLIPALVDRLHESTELPVEISVIAGLKRLAQASSISKKASIIAWGSYFSDALKAELCQDENIRNTSSEAWLAAVFDSASAHTYLDRTLYSDITAYLPDDLMVKTDRMTMAHSLEARSPFLDYRMVELTASMPARFKIRGLRQKVLLRKAFADLLSPESTNRVKRGFSLPIGAWFRRELRDFARDVLLDRRSLSRGYFRPEALRILLAEHASERHDHGYRLWTLMLLELWHQQFVDATWPSTT